MGRPYNSEMSKLADTFGWAESCDISALCRAVKTAGSSPVLAIGSGGSLTASHALVALHRRFTGKLGAVSTPLEAVSEQLDPQTGIWLLSAGGRNVDILAAFKALVLREPSQLGILCAQKNSPLAKAAREHGYVDLVLFELPAGKDSFLATNSLLAFVTLLVRAYADEFGDANSIKDSLAAIRSVLDGGQGEAVSWRDATNPLWHRETILILHGPDTRIGAIDLESKFTEAAIGNLQIADYRNFAHGRHHWLAKRAGSSAVLAFVSPGDQVLAERTLALIPEDIPLARLLFEGSFETVMITSLISALRLVGWAGEAAGIDPGRPGVPKFGRKLYRLAFPKAHRGHSKIPLSDDEAIAIERKSGFSIERLERSGELDHWKEALVAFRKRLLAARFGGVVLDYDGTVVDSRARYEPPTPRMASELVRLIEAGAWIVIATGRGASVRRDLQACLPKKLWPRILVGYYNGAEIGILDDDETPDGAELVCSALAPVAEELRRQPELLKIADQTDRRFQITLEAKGAVPENRLWDIAHQAVLMSGATDVGITRSSHSVDIVAAGVSKVNVLESLREKIGRGDILAIGDRGRWPGNDYELLRHPISLSVDELSVDPTTCWNLAARGKRGVDATLVYLCRLKSTQNVLKFE